MVLGVITLSAFLFWTAVAVAATYLGGMLLAPAQPEIESEEEIESAQSRKWLPHTSQQEGLARPRAYGKNLHHGNIIAKWTDVEDDREILYLCLDHGDGPTKGVATGVISDENFSLDGTPAFNILLDNYIDTWYPTAANAKDDDVTTYVGFTGTEADNHNIKGRFEEIVEFDSTTIDRVSYRRYWSIKGQNIHTGYEKVYLYYGAAWHLINTKNMTSQGSDADTIIVDAGGPWEGVTKVKIEVELSAAGFYLIPNHKNYGTITYKLYELQAWKLSDMEIFHNDQPVHTFKNVSIQSRPGTMNQTCMTGFEKPKLESVKNIKLAYNEPVIITTPNDFFEDIEFTLLWSDGLRKYSKEGDRRVTNSHFKVRIREHPAGGWSTLFDSYIGSDSLEPLFKKYVVNTLDPGYVVKGKQYDLEFTNNSAAKNRVINGLGLRSVREVINIPFTKPGRALVGIKAIATSQLSGRIDVKVIREDRIINTWNGVEWELKYSKNRAWVDWDILTLPAIDGDGSGENPYVIVRYDGIDPQYLDLDFFFAWAQFCDEDVLSGYGVETEHRCDCNTIVDESTDVFSLAHKIAKIGRANLYWVGHQLTGWIDDAVTTPIDLVTMDSMMHKTWKNGWAVEEELAGIVEVFYQDEKQGYERTSADWASAGTEGYKNPVTLEGIGIKTRGVAIHYAHYLLERTRLIRNTNKFRVHKDGFRYKLGDTIRLQSRIANWGKAFRVVSSTADTITVDRDASAEINPTDALHIRTYDTVLKTVVTDTYVVDSVAGKVITITVNWDVTPVKGNLVATGITKLRRIIKKTDTTDNFFDVEVETYDTDLFDADDLDPNNPNVEYVWAGTVVNLSDPVTRRELSEFVLPLISPKSDEIPKPSNYLFQDNDPGAGYISWSKADADDDIEIVYQGVSYAITPDDTNDEFVYWTPEYPTVFLTTNLAATAMAPGCWMIQINEDGEALPAFGQWIIDTRTIKDKATSDDAYTYIAGKLGLIYGTLYVCAQVTSFLATGRSVRLQCSAIFEGLTADNTVPIQVRRINAVGAPNAVYFIQGTESLTLLEDHVIQAAFDVIDEPVAGVEYHYALLARKGLDVGSINAMNRTFSVTELKK